MERGNRSQEGEEEFGGGTSTLQLATATHTKSLMPTCDCSFVPVRILVQALANRRASHAQPDSTLFSHKCALGSRSGAMSGGVCVGREWSGREGMEEDGGVDGEIIVKEQLKVHFTMLGHLPHLLASGEYLPVRTDTVLVTCSNGCFFQPAFVRHIFQSAALGATVIPIIAEVGTILLGSFSLRGSGV